MPSIIGYLAASKQAIKNLFSKPATVMFPAEHVPLPEGFRGTPVLIPENCTLCLKCERVCPTGAIMIEKIDKRKGYFTIDIGKCCYCQECENACNFDAIHLIDKWLTASDQKEDFVTKHFVDRNGKEKKEETK